jgi:hypothetical protein
MKLAADQDYSRSCDECSLAIGEASVADHGSNTALTGAQKSSDTDGVLRTVIQLLNSRGQIMGQSPRLTKVLGNGQFYVRSPHFQESFNIAAGDNEDSRYAAVAQQYELYLNVLDFETFEKARPTLPNLRC